MSFAEDMKPVKKAYRELKATHGPMARITLTLAKKIAKLAAAYGQVRVAKALGISQPTVSRIVGMTR